MKKSIVLGVLVVAVMIFAMTGALPLSAHAQPLVKKYWQDVIRKPNQTWIQDYGYDNESVLAFNVRSLLEVQNRMAQEVVALTAKVEAHDPNGVHIQMCETCGDVVPYQVTVCQDRSHAWNDPNEVKE